MAINIRVNVIGYLDSMRVVCSRVLVFAFLSLVTTVTAAVAVKTSPMVALPAYFSHQSQSQQRATFALMVNYLRAQATGLQLIADKAHDKIIRVATYDVNRWQDAEKEHKDKDDSGADLFSLCGVIWQIGADVIVLQDVGAHVQKARLALAVLGYQHYADMTSATGKSRVMIASKLPFKAQSVIDDAVRIEIDMQKFGKRNLVLYGMLFDEGSAAVRLVQARALVDYIHEHDQGKNVMVGAGFNEHMGSAIKYMASQGFINTFDLAGVDQPHFTHWSNKVFDGFYLKRDDWNAWLAGVYLVYQGSSGHLPIVVDIDFTV